MYDEYAVKIHNRTVYFWDTYHHRLILDDDTMSHSWAGTLDTECRYFEHCCVCAGAGVDSVDSAVVRGPGD